MRTIDLSETPLRELEGSEFDRLWRESRRNLMKFAYDYAKTKEDAEDLLMRTASRAWSSRATYRRERPFANWCYRIMTRLWLDELRARRIRIRAAYSLNEGCNTLDGDSEWMDVIQDRRPNAEAILTTESASQSIIEGIEGARTKLVFKLVALGEGPTEIARHLGVTQATISNAIRRVAENKRRQRGITLKNFKENYEVGE